MPLASAVEAEKSVAVAAKAVAAKIREWAKLRPVRERYVWEKFFMVTSFGFSFLFASGFDMPAAIPVADCYLLY